MLKFNVTKKKDTLICS